MGSGARRHKAGVPEEVEFQTKIEIALAQLRWACAAGLPRGVVLADNFYGNRGPFRAAITGLGLTYAVGILSNLTVRTPETEALPAGVWLDRGIPVKRMLGDGRPRVVTG